MASSLLNVFQMHASLFVSLNSHITLFFWLYFYAKKIDSSSSNGLVDKSEKLILFNILVQSVFVPTINFVPR